jgi:hypothetical protein
VDVAPEVRPEAVLGERVPVSALDLDDDSRHFDTAGQNQQVDAPAPGLAEGDRPLRGRLGAKKPDKERRLHAGMKALPRLSGSVARFPMDASAT